MKSPLKTTRKFNGIVFWFTETFFSHNSSVLTLDTGCDAMVKGGVRSVRLKNVKRSDVNTHDNVDTFKNISAKEYQSAIARHLPFNSECAKAYCHNCCIAC